MNSYQGNPDESVLTGLKLKARRGRAVACHLSEEIMDMTRVQNSAKQTDWWENTEAAWVRLKD